MQFISLLLGLITTLGTSLLRRFREALLKSRLTAQPCVRQSGSKGLQKSTTPQGRVREWTLGCLLSECSFSFASEEVQIKGARQILH